MDKITYFDQKAGSADARREALKWLARALKWEHRLGELRPEEAAEKQAA